VLLQIQISFRTILHPHVIFNPHKRQLCLATLLAVVLLASGCVSVRRTPNLEHIFANARKSTGKRPVIVIPGILGTELINSSTGEVVWPSAFRTRNESLPISPDLSANRDTLVAGKVIEKLKLSRVLPEVYVYRDLLEALRHYAGYRDGDWDTPAVDGDKDTFYVFPYDWRLDNVSNARELVRKIERLKEKLHRDDLKFNIIAHSMGGLIARYAAMYGNADLPADDVDLKPTFAGAAHISKIVMIGVPNEGSTDAFTTLIDGYSITEGIRRRVPLLNKLTAEDAISSPSVFQLLPHSMMVKFLDEDLKPIEVDLYDAKVWKKYGWSPLFTAEFQRRYHNESGGHPQAEVDESKLQQLEAYLTATLKRTQRFHQALDAVGNGPSPVTLLAIGGDCEETLSAPVILRDEKRNRWITLIRPREYRTSTGVRMSKRQVTEAMYAPGDGRVTRASLLGENLARARNNQTGFTLPLYAVFGCDLHGQLPRNKSLQDNALTAIVTEAMK
jgi:pimeloyl-ACP methyl ester carboxylesterase